MYIQFTCLSNLLYLFLIFHYHGNWKLNPLKPNDLKRRRTAQLTSRCCILYIYSTNIRNEYFKLAV